MKKEKIKQFYKEKKYKESYTLLKQYLEEIPLDSQMILLFSNICINLGLYEEAKENMERLRLRNPINPWYLYLISKIYVKLNSKEKAVEYCNKAIEYATDANLKHKLLVMQQNLS